MSASTFERLEEVVLDDVFPEVDLALRRGRHIGRDDGAAYDFLADALDHLEPLYRRFGCELIHRSDGYFYLLPSGDRLGRRRLSAGEMLVGQALALLYLDPSTLQRGGVVDRGALLERLAGLVGTETLVRTLNPRRRKFDERVAAETVRTRVAEALRRLADLGFVDLVDEPRGELVVHVADERAPAIRLRPALMRFADPVRAREDTAAALERLVASGEVLLDEEQEEEAPLSEEEPAT